MGEGGSSLHRTQAVDAVSPSILETISDVRRFVFAGKSRITVVFGLTKRRISFYIKQAAKKHGDKEGKVRPYFVMVTDLRTHEDTMVGTYWADSGGPEPAHTFKRKSGMTSPDMHFRYDLARWFLWCVNTKGSLPRSVQVWHQGYCARCGEPLTDPVSIHVGYGPTCSKRLGIARDLPPRRSEALETMPEYEDL